MPPAKFPHLSILSRCRWTCSRHRLCSKSVRRAIVVVTGKRALSIQSMPFSFFYAVEVCLLLLLDKQRAASPYVSWSDRRISCSQPVWSSSTPKLVASPPGPPQPASRAFHRPIYNNRPWCLANVFDASRIWISGMISAADLCDNRLSTLWAKPSKPTTAASRQHRTARSVYYFLTKHRHFSGFLSSNERKLYLF